MAEQGGNRTERATTRRKAEARRKGQIALSRDIPTAAVLFGGLALLSLFTGPAMAKMTHMTQAWLGRATDQAAHAVLRVDTIQTLLGAVAWDALGLALPFAVGVSAVGCMAYLVQTGWLWQGDGLRFDASRVSPRAGLTRLFSFRSVAELVKAFVKVLVIGAAAYVAVRRDFSRLPEFVQYELPATLQMAGALTFHVAMLIATTVGLVAVVDYAYQRFEWERSLRMTKEEVKQEQREAEGDPLLRSRVRSLQRQMARSRMMAAVPNADVVITNPTHVAVALRYEQKTMGAPVVVAKGAGYIAERIKEIAAEHGVMVVENKPVARTLYQLVEVGREVPVDLYRAVAEILALVYRARGQGVA
ncbi:flagellar biosynthesis protein FlhB [Candidatus Nitrospira bockiana]